ncbi:MAG: hypothetical protein ACW99F_15865, partial [Candidatus Hodarchaeales archaeon]
MGIKQKFTKFVMKRIAIPQVEKIIEAEKGISTLDGALVADEHSPERFEIVLEALSQTKTDATLPVANVKLTRTFRSIMLNMKRSL